MLEILWIICLFVLPVFGVVLAAIGIIFRLVEWGLEKPAGSLGSFWLAGAGILLCLPFIAYIGPAIVDWIIPW
jgi:hypothetical protein